MGNAEIVWCGQEVSTDPERYGRKIKNGSQGWVGEWFTTTIGTRQGDPISPNIFITYLERVMDVIQDNGTGISLHGEMINNFRFEDDLVEESFDA